MNDKKLISVPDKSTCKRVTVYMHPEHKRYIEDEAHRQRTTQFVVLHEILEHAVDRSRDWSL